MNKEERRFKVIMLEGLRYLLGTELDSRKEGTLKRRIDKYLEDLKDEN